MPWWKKKISETERKSRIGLYIEAELFLPFHHPLGADLKDEGPE